MSCNAFDGLKKSMPLGMVSSFSASLLDRPLSCYGMYAYALMVGLIMEDFLQASREHSIRRIG